MWIKDELDIIMILIFKLNDLEAKYYENYTELRDANGLIPGENLTHVFDDTISPYCLGQRD